MREIFLKILLFLPFAYAYAAEYRIEPQGKGATDRTQEIQQAIDRCSENGGKVVFVPSPELLAAGSETVFLSGPVELKKNVEVVLPAGVVWRALPDERRYTMSAFGANRGEGMLWLWARDADNILNSATL